MICNETGQAAEHAISASKDCSTHPSRLQSDLFIFLIAHSQKTFKIKPTITRSQTDVHVNV